MRRSAYAAAVPLALSWVLVAGCASTVSPTSPLPATPAAATAALQGDAALAAVLSPVVAAQLTRLRLPGAVVVVDVPGRGAWRAALGVGNVATNEPMRVDDHIRIGSLTKTMTATVVLQLAEEGKLALDAPLARYVPGTTANGATVRQALQMTSGIASYTSDAFLDALAGDPGRVWSPTELAALGKGQPPNFAAGKGWEYSNTNYILLGLIAEQVSRTPLAQLFQQRIFGPLRMNGCSLPAATDASIPPPYSHGYMVGKGWGLTPVPAAAQVPPLTDVSNWNPSWGWAAGGVSCTSADLMIWAKALATGALLTPAMQQERLTWLWASKDPPVGYGLGIGNWDGMLGHNGEISGYQSKALYRPSDGTTIVVLTNLTASVNGEGPAEAITAAITSALQGAPPR